MVHIEKSIIGGKAQVPFGGIKATGVGDPEIAEEGASLSAELKTVYAIYLGSA